LPSEEQEQKARSKRSLTEEAFRETLIAATSTELAVEVAQFVAELRAMGLVPQWRTTGVSMRLPDPGGLGREWTVLFLGADGTFWVGYLSHISQYGGYDEQIWRRYLASTKQLTGVEGFIKLQDGTKAGAVGDLLRHRDEFMVLLRRFIADLENAARAREV
jgi:hypothetical protein